jgi:hypothetical protein
MRSIIRPYSSVSAECECVEKPPSALALTLAGGKMHPPEKYPRNEKLKFLKAHAELHLDVLMQEMDSNAVTIQILLLIIELIEAEEEPEDPG